MAYNHSIHATTKLSPFNIIYGHLDPKDLLDIDIETQVLNDYIQKHKDKTQILYKIVNERNINAKEKYIGNRNRDRQDVNMEDALPQTVYVQNKQKQSKLKNKYKPETLTRINTEQRTGEIVPQHHNTQTKIHLSNIKKPRKKTNTFKN